uniref:interleukin-13 receptor subunit alpha-1-like n=1 Tax=Semicossyphus pulcher TaxID=241346 RepID=UPI0037E86034
MTFNLEFFAVTFSAMSLVLHSKADCPPPSNLTHNWLDPFTVNVSWEKPHDLLNKTHVNYKYTTIKNGKDQDTTGTGWTNFTVACLTEEMDSNRCTYSVWTDDKSCSSSDEITHQHQRVNISVKSRKPSAQVVKGFKCVIHSEEADCSWIPVDRSLNLTLSYRICGRSAEHMKGLKVCDHLYINGTRMGCFLKVDATKGDIYILVETEAGMSTFKPKLEVPLPKLSIKENGSRLKLSFERLEVGKDCKWQYEICHKKCSYSKECKNYTSDKHVIEVAYDERCHYEFQYRIMADYCPEVSSDFSEVVTYGTDKPDVTLTVVAIVVPIILSICVLLSCYCLRRHSAIICPNIPDPSAIFKEMMMNGNKELKTTTGSLYTPVPEPLEPCRITPVNENSILQQNI